MSSIIKLISSVGLPAWVIIGGTLGVMAGVFFGDSCAVLKPLGSAYIMMVQAVVYPYLICSLLHGLGRLDPARSRRLFKAGWPIFLAAWVGTFAAIFLLSRAIPSISHPAVMDFSAAARPGPSFLELIIPSDIFAALAKNYIPGVVAFAACFGIAIQRFEKKEGLLNILDLFRRASVRVWQWIVYLTPVAVFALFAETAGTVDVSHLEDLMLYVVMFLGGTFIMAFWVVPMAISALVPTTYREVLKDMRNAIVLSTVTTLSVVSLPFIYEAAKKLVSRVGVEEGDSEEIIETTLSLSYPLGQLGNFFLYLFVLFAVFFFKSPLQGGEVFALPPMTFLSCIGAPASTYNAISFLGSWLHLPAAAVQLYVETVMVTKYGQVMLSVMGFAFLTFLTTLAYYGKLKVRVGRLLVCLLVWLVSFCALMAGARAVYEYAIPKAPNPYLNFTLDRDIVKGIDATVCETPDQWDREHPGERMRPGETVFERIQRTGTLRVGYMGHVIPFSYFNADHELVGYDIAFAYDLARMLDARLVFIPFEWYGLIDDLKAGRFDIAMSGIYLKADRLREVAVSQPYFQSSVAFIVPWRNVEHFKDVESIKAIPDLTLATFKAPVLQGFLKDRFPDAKILVLSDYGDLNRETPAQGAVWTLEQAKSWAEANPGFTAVKPRGLGAVMVFSYLMPPDSQEFTDFVNHWLELRKADGFQERQRDYWILGRPRLTEKRRWSIIHNVLHWREE